MPEPAPSFALPLITPAAPNAAAWQLREVWLRWAGVGVVTLVLASFVEARGTLPAWRHWLLTLGITAAYWQGSTALFFRLRRRYPEPKETARRVALQVLLAASFVGVGSLGIAWLNIHLREIPLPYWRSYQRAYWFGLFATVFINSIYESVYFFLDWQASLVRAAAFERESAISRLEALKQQVDPHFLFNSLNTMAALIGDNGPAQDFLGSLADVYRYVLLSKDNSTVPLSQELAFVDAYLYLNAIRFGDNLQVVKEINAEALPLHVPPIAVQLLIENAIKHNAISRQAPLRITIRAAEGVLSVTNTIHRKTILEKSTKQGLQNIVNRFQFLTDRQLLIENRGSEFEVVLPLLPAV